MRIVQVEFDRSENTFGRFAKILRTTDGFSFGILGSVLEVQHSGHGTEIECFPLAKVSKMQGDADLAPVLGDHELEPDLIPVMLDKQAFIAPKTAIFVGNENDLASVRDALRSADEKPLMLPPLDEFPLDPCIEPVSEYPAPAKRARKPRAGK